MSISNIDISTMPFIWMFLKFAVGKQCENNNRTITIIVGVTATATSPTNYFSATATVTDSRPMDTNVHAKYAFLKKSFNVRCQLSHLIFSHVTQKTNEIKLSQGQKMLSIIISQR